MQSPTQAQWGLSQWQVTEHSTKSYLKQEEHHTEQESRGKSLPIWLIQQYVWSPMTQTPDSYTFLLPWLQLLGAHLWASSVCLQGNSHYQVRYPHTSTARQAGKRSFSEIVSLFGLGGGAGGVCVPRESNHKPMPRQQGKMLKQKLTFSASLVGRFSEAKR